MERDKRGKTARGKKARIKATCMHMKRNMLYSLQRNTEIIEIPMHCTAITTFSIIFLNEVLSAILFALNEHNFEFNDVS